MFRFPISLVAILIMLLAWGPSPAGADAAEYQSAVNEYNQSTARVQSAQASLNQARADVVSAQAVYDRATTEFNQAQAQLDALNNKMDNMLNQMQAISNELKNLSLFRVFEAQRLTEEHTRLYGEWFKAKSYRYKLQTALDSARKKKVESKFSLEDAKRALSNAESHLTWAKQEQKVAERELARVRNKGQAQVTTTNSFGSGHGNVPYWLLQVLARWNQPYLPGSTIGLTTTSSSN